MIYRSNLLAPDLEPFFRHTFRRVMGHSIGHDVISDNELYPNCGYLTHDEAAILYTLAQLNPGRWVDIGAHTGWTAAHIASAHKDNFVYAVEPMWELPEWRQRSQENLAECSVLGRVSMEPRRSYDFFPTIEKNSIVGVMIDGDHGEPIPYRDAQGAVEVLTENGVAMLHDFRGKPTFDAADYLISQGFKAKTYWTPHVVSICWRGDIRVPEHVHDPKVKASMERYVPKRFGGLV